MSMIIDFIRVDNINPVIISIVFVMKKHTFFFIRIGRHLGYAKRQFENILEIFAAVPR